MIKGSVWLSSQRHLILSGRPWDIQLIPAAAPSAEHSTGPVSQLPANVDLSATLGHLQWHEVPAIRQLGSETTE